jgi:hypothetical protein
MKHKCIVSDSGVDTIFFWGGLFESKFLSVLSISLNEVICNNITFKMVLLLCPVFNENYFVTQFLIYT